MSNLLTPEEEARQHRAWLRTRRSEAHDELVRAFRAEDYSNLAELARLVCSFDKLIAALPPLPPPVPKPVPPKLYVVAKRTASESRALEHAEAKADAKRRALEARKHAERRRLGLLGPVAEPEPASPLPLPVVEVAEEPSVGDHVIADDVSRRASVMMAYGYSFGRRRSRRYEGLR